MLKNKLTYLIFIMLVLVVGACNKEPYSNPYVEVENNEAEDEEIVLAATSLAGLHANIFRPTCANSGCHDGTFEPDFRTIQSTYNTLVNQPIIKNDPQGSLTYRVVPSNPAQSQLMTRLTKDIDGNSGNMPLVTEPDSDWDDKANDYIENIRQWIQNGARNE